MDRFRYWKFSAVVFLLCWAVRVEARTANERGRPLYHFYSPDDYNAHAQNWACVQDSTGRMFFANNHGVLRFDGIRWQLAPSLNGGLIRSLVKDDSGTLFWGGQNDFGIVGVDSSGSTVLKSLSHLLPDTIKSYNNVWNIMPSKYGVYFLSNKYIFRYFEGHVSVISNRNKFLRGFLVDGKVIVQQGHHGLYYLKKNTFTFIPGSDVFLKDHVAGIIKLHNGKWLVLTFFKGLYEYNGQSFKPFGGPVNPIIKRSFGYKALKLKSGNIAIGTIQNGLFLINQQGNLLNSLHIEQLPVTGLYEDDEGGLWTTLDGGLARIEIEGPLSIFSKKEGLPGQYYSVTRYDNTMFAAGNSGVYKLVQSGLKPPYFQKLMGFSHQTWDLLATKHGLLMATQEGLYVYHHNKIETVIPNLVVRTFEPSRIIPGMILVGCMYQLRTLKYQNGQWHISSAIPGLTTNNYNVAESPDSTIWLGTQFQGIVRVKNFYNDKKPVISKYTVADGLPKRDNKATNPFLLKGHIAIGTSRGLYRLDTKTNRMVPDSSFGAPFTGRGKGVFEVAKSKDGDWFIRSDDNGILIPGKGSHYSWDNVPFRRISTGATYSFYLEGDTVAWLATRAGVVRYERDKKADYHNGKRALLNKVSLINSDSLVYGGYYQRQKIVPALTYLQNAIRFQLGLPRFDRPGATEFSFRLVGSNNKWSEWTHESQKDYTNLPPGTFTFEVRAKDLYGNISLPSRYKFIISPPWYQTSLAYIIYVILGFGFISLILFLAMRWNSRRLADRNRELELQVELRTTEIEQQKRVIEQQVKALEEQRALRTRYFANISHEFRTPLTLIITPLESMIQGHYGGISESIKLRCQSILQNARRVNQLISQLLDLSRLELGKMPYKPVEIDLVEELRKITNSFKPLAERESIRFGFESNIDEFPYQIDRDAFLKIIANLLSNAFKFTPSSGTIAISLEKKGAELKITVSDSGKGIDADKLDKIFERFYQADLKDTRLYEGSGIGLALVKELLQLSGGTIKACSESGQGATFIITLPGKSVHENTFTEIEPSLSNRFEDSNLLYLQDVEISPLEEASQNSEILSEQDKPTLLVVDDHPGVRRIINHQFKSRYHILEASDGQHAFELTKKEFPDIIISDVMMPGTDGLMFLEMLRSDPVIYHLPVILLTAKAEISDRLEGLEKGADAYLPKPFNQRELRVLVDKLLAKQHALRDKFRKEALAEAEQVEVLSEDEKLIARLKNLIKQHLSDTELSIEMLAKKAGLSQSQLQRRLSQILHCTPSQFVRTYRLQHARQLIEQNSGSISEIAYSVGFNSLSYFSKCFKEVYGIAPSDLYSDDLVEK